MSRPWHERAIAYREVIVSLWADAEHDHARVGMLLTLRGIYGNDFFPMEDWENLPTADDLRAELSRRSARET